MSVDRLLKTLAKFTPNDMTNVPADKQEYKMLQKAHRSNANTLAKYIHKDTGYKPTPFQASGKDSTPENVKKHPLYPIMMHHALHVD